MTKQMNNVVALLPIALPRLDSRSVMSVVLAVIPTSTNLSDVLQVVTSAVDEVLTLKRSSHRSHELAKERLRALDAAIFARRSRVLVL